MGQQTKNHATLADKALTIAFLSLIAWVVFFLPSRADTFEGEISVVFCRAVADCVEHKWPQEKVVIPSMCGYAAQQLAVEWIEQHPLYHVASMRCGRRTISL